MKIKGYYTLENGTKEHVLNVFTKSGAITSIIPVKESVNLKDLSFPVPKHNLSISFFSKKRKLFNNNGLFFIKNDTSFKIYPNFCFRVKLNFFQRYMIESMNRKYQKHIEYLKNNYSEKEVYLFFSEDKLLEYIGEKKCISYFGIEVTDEYHAKYLKGEEEIKFE